MTIPQPKFAVGETIILQSINFPEYNGEYVIKDMEYGNMMDYDSMQMSWGWAYNLGFDVLGIDIWDESNLRKKHTPVSKSFTRLMQDCNNRVPL